jgi:hypothetical protein
MTQPDTYDPSRDPNRDPNEPDAQPAPGDERDRPAKPKR